jgi:hypothetical protein
MIARALISFMLLVAVGSCAGKSQPPQPPLPTQLVGAKNISMNDGHALLETNVLERPNRPELLADLSSRPGMILWAMYKVCVGADGQVGALRIIKPADYRSYEDQDENWIRVIRRWRYKPYLEDGQARPFCYPVRIEVRS